MDRPWLSQYPAGVPAEIDVHRFASLKDVLEAICQRFADRPAYRSMGTAMSFRQLDDASRAFAAWLQKNTDLQRGDRVALMMPNLLPNVAITASPPSHAGRMTQDRPST